MERLHRVTKSLLLEKNYDDYYDNDEDDDDDIMKTGYEDHDNKYPLGQGVEVGRGRFHPSEFQLLQIPS